MARLSFCFLFLAMSGLVTGKEFTGKVADSITGDPIVGASVFLQDNVSNGRTVITRSDAQGNFRFNSDAPFVLRVEHPDFERLLDVVRSNPATTLQLGMISTSSTQLTTEEKDLLANLASTDGRALFLFPYQLQTDIAGFDELLEFNLDAAINSHLQSLDLDIITVQLLPAELNEQGNRILLYGRALKALALVSGVTGSLSSGKINIRSRIRIVPGGQGLIFVSDQIDPADISAAAFDSELNELWGQSTFLSIAYRRFEEATTTNPVNTAELGRIQDTLIAFIRDMPDANSHMTQQAQRLFDAIEKRLRQ